MQQSQGVGKASTNYELTQEKLWQVASDLPTVAHHCICQYSHETTPTTSKNQFNSMGCQAMAQGYRKEKISNHFSVTVGLERTSKIKGDSPTQTLNTFALPGLKMVQ